MATIWQKTVRGKHYQVRQAGNSIRLYTDGVFHSQYNPNKPLGGTIWDLLVLPALFKPNNIQRVLILGLGGGAVIRGLDSLLPNRHFTAIEIDKTHIQIAKRYFNVRTSKQVKLIHADAIEWVLNYQGPQFDYILDDLFLEKNGFPDRAANHHQHWCNKLLSLLSPSGVLAVNFDHPKHVKQSALYTDDTIARHFRSRFTLSVPNYDNRIAAFFRQSVSKNDLEKALLRINQQQGKRVDRHLIANIRKL